MAAQVAREKLVHLGTSIGKMTHSGKFRLTVGCLDLLAQHAKYKVYHSLLLVNSNLLVQTIGYNLGYPGAL